MNKYFHWNRCIQIVAVLAAFACATELSAQGFRAPVPGTFALARAGGHIAQVEDSSAATHNPANLTYVQRLEGEFDPQELYIKTEFTTNTGQKGDNTHPFHFIPAMWAAVPVKGTPVTVGLGTTAPWGIAMNFDGTQAFGDPTSLRYQTAFYTELTTMNINPSAGVKINDQLRVGAGIDIMQSRLELRQWYPWGLVVPGSADGELHAVAHGTALSADAAITFEPVEGHRIAATYRAPMRMDYKGRLATSNIPAALGGGESSSDFETRIDFPAMLTLGYGVQVTPKLRLESDVEYLFFSSVQDLPLMARNPGLPPGVPTSIRSDWHDSINFGVAGDYEFMPGLQALFTYKYYTTCIPSYTFIPTVPDASEHSLGAGVRWKHGRHTVALSYAYSFYETRHIGDNQIPQLNGTYDTEVQLVNASWAIAF